MASYIIIYLLFLLQFIYFPIGVSFFETPKVYLAQLGIFILLLLAVIRTKTPILKHIPKSYLITFSVIVVLSILHLIFLNRETTFFGNDFRLQGVLLLWMLIAWAILSAQVVFEKLLHPVFLFGVIVSQLFFAFIIDGEGAIRAIGTIGEPNALAAAVLFIWPFLFFSKKPVSAWMKYAATVIVFVLIFISGSRSGMIAFVLQMIFLLLSERMALAQSVIVSLVLLVLAYALPFMPTGNLYEQRSEIWQAAVSAGMYNPWIGNGFGNAEYALQDTVNALQSNLRGSYVDSSHNIFLDWWVQGGLPGFVLFAFLIVTIFVSFIKHKRTMHIILLLGLIAALSFNPPSIVTLLALWWLIGQGMFVSKAEQK